MASVSLLLTAAMVVAEPPPCKKFSEIYANGKELCEKMWGGAFEVVDEPAESRLAYEPATPGASPKVTKNLVNLGKGTAHDGDFYGRDPVTNLPEKCINSTATKHREKPGFEPGLQVCRQYMESSCCKSDVILSRATLNGLYGPEHSWDRCGRLSSQCEEYFVQEACLYECEPAAKFFLKYRQGEGSEKHDQGFDPKNQTHQDFSWQLSGMPLTKEFCNGWFNACKNDKFCAEDNGNYFSCARKYEEHDKRQESLKSASASDDSLEPGYIALIVIVGVVAVCAVAFIAYLIMMEKKGKPVYYTPVSNAGDRAGEPAEMQDKPPTA